MDLQIALPEGTVGFHMVNVGSWTMSVSVHVPDGDDYVVTTEGADFTETLNALKEELIAHD